MAQLVQLVRSIEDILPAEQFVQAEAPEDENVPAAQTEQLVAVRTVAA